jgi:hypothetical protein
MRRKIWCDGWKRKYFGLGWESGQGLSRGQQNSSLRSSRSGSLPAGCSCGFPSAVVNRQSTAGCRLVQRWSHARLWCSLGVSPGRSALCTAVSAPCSAVIYRLTWAMFRSPIQVPDSDTVTTVPVSEYYSNFCFLVQKIVQNLIN